MKPIFLFDIDGTLLHVKRSFLFDIIGDLLDAFQINIDTIKNSSFAGRTDRDIFSQLITLSGKENIDFDHLKSLYIQQMESNLSVEHIDIIPEAIESVYYLHNNGYEMGLCTGNFKEVAFLKVGAVGLKGMFGFGGFGCNHADRNFLPGEAHHDYLSVKGGDPKREQFIVIGDTPNDITCAKYFGARSIAVTTGGFNEEQLGRYNPDYILPGLHNPEEWISKL